MTKADLVERVTAQISRTAGPMISKKDCARVVDSFLDAIKEALQEQKNIEVRGFGTFKIRHRSKPIFAVQYHPEAAPGPHDARPLFDAFMETVRDHAKSGGGSGGPNS